MKKIDELLAEIAEARFLRPDGSPEVDWVLFSGPSLQAAASALHQTLQPRVAGAGAFVPLDQKIATATDKVMRGEFFELENARARVASAVTQALGGMADRQTERFLRRDAETIASLIIARDQNLKDWDKYWEYAEKCWREWTKGYCLRADFRGQQYVYFVA